MYVEESLLAFPWANVGLQEFHLRRPRNLQRPLQRHRPIQCPPQRFRKGLGGLVCLHAE